jgi:hypothetical protein
MLRCVTTATSKRYARPVTESKRGDGLRRLPSVSEAFRKNVSSTIVPQSDVASADSKRLLEGGTTCHLLIPIVRVVTLDVEVPPFLIVDDSVSLESRDDG